MQLRSRDLRANSWIPDVILGDLDSLRPRVRRYYEKRGSAVIHDDDQNATDLTKCLHYVRTGTRNGDSPRAGPLSAMPPTQSRLDIVVLGSLCGRVDQAFATLQPLIVASHDSSHPPHRCNGQILLVTSQNVSFILRPGRNKIHTPLSQGILAESVGIVPLGETATITTRGLEWDVQGWETQMGGNVSTSNHVEDDIVEVDVKLPNETKGAVMFTIELAKAEKGLDPEWESEEEDHVGYEGLISR